MTDRTPQDAAAADRSTMRLGLRVVSLQVAASSMAAALESFRMNPTRDLELRLRECRLILARTYLDRKPHEFGPFLGRAWRDVFGTFVRMGFRTLPPRPDEIAARDQAAELLSRRTAPDLALAPLLAFSLFEPPHRLPRIPDLARLSPETIPLVTAALYAEPEFFQAPGDAERYVAYVEDLTRDFRRIAEGDLPIQYRQAIAESLARRARFVMTYFSDRNLRELLENRARIMETWLRSVGMPIEHAFSPRRPGRRKLRLGLLRGPWTAGTETAASFAHLNGVDRDRFETYLYTTELRSGDVEAAAKLQADHFRVVPTVVADAAAEIRADDLDLMLIGTNVVASSAFMAFLVAFRLARTQAALTLSPATTGFESMDAYLNGTLNEPSSAQEEYSERLVLVPGSINRYDFRGEPRAAEVAIARSALGLDDGCFVFVSGASFFKIVPELLEAWAAILRATPGSRLVLYPFNPNWGNIHLAGFFARHLYKFMAERGVERDRIRLVNQQGTRDHVHAIIRNADLYLDSFPFSGAVSMIDPMRVGCPVIVLRGNSARCRQSAAFLEELGFAEMIVASPEAYVAEAVRLFQDRADLAARRRKLADFGPRLDQLASLDLSDTFVRMAAARG